MVFRVISKYPQCIVWFCHKAHVCRTDGRTDRRMDDFQLSCLNYSRKLVKCCLRVCPNVCLDDNQGGINRNRCTQRLVILRALINPDRPPKSLTYFSCQNHTSRKWARIGIFKPAEPCSQRNACFTTASILFPEKLQFLPERDYVTFGSLLSSGNIADKLG